MLKYRNFIRTLSERMEQSLATIETEHNFEYGAEFEIALCDALRSALPDRYGVNRGYIVDEQGTTAGDDIVISARERFPTLALRGRDDFARKEFVPIESAYCYIEAKHTLDIEGSGPQSLARASQQVERVKILCKNRKKVEPRQIGPYLKIFDDRLNIQSPPGYPSILNPMFGAIFARRVRQRPDRPFLTDPEIIRELVLKQERIGGTESPDLVVLGDSLVIIPTLGGKEYCSPFFIPDQSLLQIRPVDKTAFGIAITSLMSALDWIQLGVMPWRSIVGESLIGYDELQNL